MSRFEYLSKGSQLAIITGSTLLLLLSGFSWLMLILWSWYFIFAIPFFSSLFQFLATPLYTRIKIFDYLSPMLMVNLPSSKIYELHHGTSFDYLLNLCIHKTNFLKRELAVDYLEGLLVIIKRIENKQLSPDVIIKGSTYFIDKKTATRFGFTIENVSWKEYFFLSVNYIDLLWMFSLSRRRFSFPNIMKTKTLTTTGSILETYREPISDLLERLKRQT